MVIQTKLLSWQEVGDIIKYDDVAEAVRQLNALKQLMLNSDQDSKNELEPMVLILQWVRFPGLPDQECLNLVRTHLLIALSMEDFELVEKVQTKIRFVEGDMDQIMFVESLEQAILQNEELLGNQSIVVSQKKVTPTIKNWIKDYQNFPTNNIPRGNLDQLNYVNRSNNTRTLSAKEKNNLLIIFKLFEIVEKFLFVYKNGPPAKNEQAAFVDFDLYATLPGLIFQGKTEAFAGQNFAQKNTFQSNILSPPSPLKKVSLPKKATANSESSSIKITSPKNTIDIDKKLEELKKKIK